jgi:hypothetical protein
LNAIRTPARRPFKFVSRNLNKYRTMQFVVKVRARVTSGSGPTFEISGARHGAFVLSGMMNSKHADMSNSRYGRGGVKY